MLKNNKALARSKSIDHQLEEERERRHKELQLLILGGAGSGKSTFIKQLRLRHGDGFPEIERSKQLSTVYENLTDALNVVIDNMEKLELQYDIQENKLFAVEFQRLFPRCRHYHVSLTTTGVGACVNGGKEAEVIPIPVSPILREKIQPPEYHKLKDYVNDITKLWQDGGFQACYRSYDPCDPILRHSEAYFLKNIDRVLQKDYVPTIQDILCVRQPTVGVQEHTFVANGLSYRVIDVAGQKNQRKKWIHFFEGVTAVLFFAALNGFCECLEEEQSLNSMQDSLATFVEVAQNVFLDKTDFILFLNKKDLFEERLKTKRLSSCFPDYTGDNTVEDASAYIKQVFLKRKPPQKTVYSHVSCAIDRDSMKTIIDNVTQIIVEINLRTASGAF